MGDTNEWRDAGGCLKELNGSYRVAPTGPSFHSRRPIAALDRIIVDHELAIEAAGVHASAEARKASDHLPIWATGGSAARPLTILRCRRRWIDEPMPIASRYLATVRRARSKPCSLSKSTSVSSLKISVFLSDQLADRVLDRLRRRALAAFAGDARAEEIFELEHAPVAGEIFVGGDPADGRFMHLDRLGDLGQGQRPERRHAVLEEALLLLHDLGRNLDDRLRALVERLDQPVGAGQALAEPGLRRLVLRPALQLGMIAAVDQHLAAARHC